MGTKHRRTGLYRIGLRRALLAGVGTCLFAAIVGPTPALGAERLVLLEKFTASWCPPCRPSSEAVDELLHDFPDSFIPMEMFASSSSRYFSPWSRNRATSFYDFPGYPTVWFDSAVDEVGGSEGSYDSYKSKMLARAAIPSEVSINLSAVQTGDQIYEVTTTVGVDASGTSKVMRLYLSEVLDHYGIYDNSSIVPRNTFRQNVEDSLIVAVNPGESTSFTRSVTFDSVSWDNFENIKMVAWAQFPSARGPAEIYNAAQLVLADAALPGDFDGDGDVDSSDLVIWQRNFSSGIGGDADNDGDSDGNDFLLWQQNLNNGSGVGAAIGVPEPTTGVLCLTLLATLGVARRRRNY